MGRGGNKTQRVDIIDSFDPRTVGRAAQKGTLFRYIPAAGTPVLLIKTDDGFSTNWEALGGSQLPITVVDVASTGNIDLANLPATIDGLTPTTFLAKDQAAPEENGVYDYTGVGLAATRSVGWDTAGDFVPGRQVFADDGTANADTLWANADYVVTLDVDPVTFVKVSSSVVVGDPNTMAYFDAAGNLTDNTSAKFNGATNSMAHAIEDTGGTTALAGRGSYISGFATNGGNIETTDDGGSARGYCDNGDILASSIGATAAGAAGDSGTINASGNGAHAHGYAFGVNSLVRALGDGATAFGFSQSGGTLLASDVGCTAIGCAEGGGQILAGGANACFALGYAGTTSVISSSANGAQATGHADVDATIEASGNGAHAFGSSTNSASLQAIGAGSLSHGYADGAGSLISAAGIGSSAQGIAQGGGQISSPDAGSFAFGFVGAAGIITASNNGSFAYGYADVGGGSILASNKGAVAHGQVINTASIESSGLGSQAHGSADGAGSVVRASGTGATASGSADSASEVRATGICSMASGYATSGSILNASGIGSFSFGFASSATGFISSTGAGSMASGQSGDGNIQATSTAAIAQGLTNSGFAIVASGLASRASGSTSSGAVIASGEVSIAHGNNIEVSANFAMAYGNGLLNTSFSCLVIGQFNDDTGFDLTTWVATDPLFVLGNGANSGSRANAYRVDKDGAITETGSIRVPIRTLTGTATVSARTDRKLLLNDTGGSANDINLPAGEEGLTFKFGVATGNTGSWLLSPDGVNNLDALLNVDLGTSGPIEITFSGNTWYLV